MLTIGISISRDRICAVALDGSASAPRIAATVSVPCGEPFGGAEDAVALAVELRGALPGAPLSGAVLTLPPPLTYLRPLTLPVTDLPRARAIHIAELEGNLPIEDEEILSDLLPPAPAPSDLFFAVAAKRSLVETTAENFRSAGIPVDRVVTDHVALLALASSGGGPPPDGIYLSAFSDILLLRVSGGGVPAARQFPLAMADAPGEILSAVREAAGDVDAASAPARFLVGAAPGSIAAAVPEATFPALPEALPQSHLAAYGAALAALRPKVAAGFSLRTSADAASEKERGRRRTVVAGVAAGVAVLLALGALQFTVWAEGQKAAKARAMVRTEFTAAAPDVRNVVQAGAQIREKLESLRRQQKELGTDGPSPTDLLMAASRSLPKGEIALREVSIDGVRLRLAGEAGGGAKLVESYRAALAETFGPAFTVTVQESEGSARGASVRFTILVDRKGERRAS